MTFRIGQGFDVHAFARDRKCILCGVEIPCDRGLLGHSDADVAIHALMDAILGAAGSGDIGELFPDCDPVFAGADSMKLLESVLNHPNVAPYRVVNADITIIAQMPKISPYKEAMKERLVRALACENVNVKATTTEKLGFAGRGEGIAALASVLLEKR